MLTQSPVFLRKAEFIRDRAEPPLDQHQLPRGVNALPLLTETPRTNLVINRRVDQTGFDAPRERCSGVVHGTDNHDVSPLRIRHPDLKRLVIGVVEWLDDRVKSVVEARSCALEDEVERCFVAGLAEGAVAPIVDSDLVEVPEDVSKSGGGQLDRRRPWVSWQQDCSLLTPRF
jgi:hypothetical protein